MSRDLYQNYANELTAIRHLAREFGAQYRGVAGRLELEGGESKDPHVERLLQGFAFLAGRVHRRLDDDFPELTQGMLNILYPHFLAPVPSCLVAQFEGNYNQDPLVDGFTIPRRSSLSTTSITAENGRDYQNLACEFRTTYDVKIWPISVVGARCQQPPWTNLRLPSTLKIPAETRSICQLQLQSNSVPFSQLSLDQLRFYLSGGPHVAELYETLLTDVISVVFLSVDQAGIAPLELHPTKVLSPVGFEEDEALLDYPPQSFPGYRLMTEFFSYPRKFNFVDVKQFDRFCRKPKLGDKGVGHRVDILFFLKKNRASLESGVEASTFRLGCTPAVNLFEQLIEPVQLEQTKYEYKLTPDRKQPLGMEIYSVDDVQGIDLDNKPINYRPFYALYQESRLKPSEAFWYATRRPSILTDDPGTDVYLSLVDRNWDPVLPASQKLLIKTTCTNREMSKILERTGDKLQLQLGISAPLMNNPQCVNTPSRPFRHNRNARGSYWKLISHLSLNHLSLTQEIPRDRNGGAALPGATNTSLAALQEILRLYNIAGAGSGHPQAEINEGLIRGLTGLTSRRIVERLMVGGHAGFARGVEIEVELDEERYVGTGAFLFASVLERFFALYTTVNSFTCLVAKTAEGGRMLKRWPPRAGTKELL